MFPLGGGEKGHFRRNSMVIIVADFNVLRK